MHRVFGQGDIHFCSSCKRTASVQRRYFALRSFFYGNSVVGLLLLLSFHDSMATDPNVLHTLQMTHGFRSAATVQSSTSSSEGRRKTLEAFQSAAEVWRKAGGRVELPQEADRHRILAESAFNEKDIGRALKHFKAAIEIYPTWPQGQFNLAVLCGEIKDFECAYIHMKEYLILAPDAPDARTAYEKTVIWEDKLDDPSPSELPAALPAGPGAEEASVLYKGKCAGCHGTDGGGRTAAGKKLGVHDFHSKPVKNAPDDELLDVVRTGRGKMPGFDGKLTDNQIRQLIAYIRALRPQKRA